MAASTPKTYEDRFREDIAAQLRGIGEGHVSINHDRVVLELESGSEGTLRIVAGFNEDRIGRVGWSEWLQLRTETEDRTTPLLTLAWLDADDEARLASLESRLDAGMPLAARGLNAAADIREGAYASGDVLERLRRDLGAVMGQAGSRPQAIVPVSAPQRSVAAPGEGNAASREMILNTEFEPVAQALTARSDAQGNVRIPSLEELKEMLIARTFEAMQDELLKREAQLARSGVLSSAKQNFLEAIEWSMLGVAYAVDAVTSRTAIGTFLPGEASWLYGLVGPVLIGGIGSLAKEKIDKAAAFGLMASWALFVGLVTASDEKFMNGAQAWFPKG
jgi:hypothetical protein